MDIASALSALKWLFLLRLRRAGWRDGVDFEKIEKHGENRKVSKDSNSIVEKGGHFVLQKVYTNIYISPVASNISQHS